MTHCVSSTITRNERSIARRGGARRRSFTLIELLITIMIIAMLAAMVLFALFRAQEEARSRKTSALISRLDAIIKGKYESYKTRRVPVRIPPGTNPNIAAKMRLDALRDLMRMELPDRYTDIVEVNVGDVLTTMRAGPVTPIPAPALWSSYLRRVVAAVGGGTTPTAKYQGAECLHMIVMSAVLDESDARSVFKADNIGDADNDGMAEFIDGWGQPIKFLRWAPGIQSDLQIVARGEVLTFDPGPPATATLTGTPPSTSNSAFIGGTMAVLGPVDPGNGRPIDSLGTAKITGYNGTTGVFTFAMPVGAAGPAFNVVSSQPQPGDQVVIMAPDPFDPLGVYPLYTTTQEVPSFALYPLIYSAGPDGKYRTVATATDPTNGGKPWSYPVRGNNPYVVLTSTNPTNLLFGSPATTFTEPTGTALDNIHNHTMGVR